MSTIPAKLVVYAMEVATEAFAGDMTDAEKIAYVEESLIERFPSIGPLTLRVVATEIVTSRNRGLW